MNEAEERAKFEAWAKKECFDITFDKYTQTYTSVYTGVAWTTWKARASLAPTVPTEPTEPLKLNDEGQSNAAYWHSQARQAREMVVALLKEIEKLKAAPPPQRKPLTNPELTSILYAQPGNLELDWFYAYARAIEKAHGITGESA